MSKKRPFVLSIAGFDPCSGAGISADIKTFETHKTYGLGVLTSNTIQTESNFKKCIWINKNVILEQLDLMLYNYKIKFVKIGIVENWDILIEIIDFLLYKKNNIKIIWDPILKTETGFSFFHNKILLKNILSKIYLFTPNYNELEILSNNNIKQFIKENFKKTNIFLKGGHRNDNKKYYDYLYTKEEKIYPFRPKKITQYNKHGTGCVISSAITSNLSLGYPLLKSCLKAKDYTTYFICSNKTKLGFHK